MTPQIISGIKIHVSVIFREDLSRVDEGSYFYNYEMTIENQSEYNVQLLSRYWKIDHLMCGNEVVKGEGVVGVQPEILSKGTYSYVSGCDLMMPFGNMSGFYYFKNLNTNQLFSVPIPKFNLIYPPFLN